MSTDVKELKKRLQERIENTDDEAILQTVIDILDHKYTPQEITLTSYQEHRIEEAKKSFDHGKALTNEQADQLVDTWLNE